MARGKAPDPRQSSLFGDASPAASSAGAASTAPSAPSPYAAGPAARLPASIRFGTSSWTYPGWKGTVYRREYPSKKSFREDTLAEYASHPIFRCVGIDSSFYGPPSPRTLLRYAAQTPPTFRWVPKVWEQITTPFFGGDRLPRGFSKGDQNPAYLDPEVFVREVLPPWEQEGVRARTGVLLFQFASLGANPPPRVIEDFVEHLDWFLGAIPRTFRYAIEIRTEALVQPWWFDLLHRHGVAHCFNHWDRMPPLAVQQDVAASASVPPPPFRVVRLLTPRNTTYKASVARFEPFERLQEESPEAREGTAGLILDALHAGMETYVLANNRLEGHSPATIDGIARMVLERLPADGVDGGGP